MNVVVLWTLPTHFCKRMCISYFDRTYVCRIYCAIYLWMYSEFGVLEYSEQRCRCAYCACVTDEVRTISTDRMDASLRRLRVDQRGLPSRRVLIITVSTEGSQACRTGSVRHRLMMQSFGCITVRITSVIRTYSLLTITFCYCYFYRGSTVLSHHVGRRRMMWLK